MAYAKINTVDGAVIEFPYYLPGGNLLPNQTLPADVVEVDTQTNKPVLRWDQKVNFAGASKVGNNYVATYLAPVDKYADSAAKLKAITGLKKMYQDLNKRNFEAKVNDLVALTTKAERESWDRQATEALAYTNDNTASTPLLSVMAAQRGITLADLVNKVMVKFNEYSASYGALIGAAQKNEDILSSIDLNDDTTWNSIDLIVGL